MPARCESILNIQANGLKNRLAHIHRAVCLQGCRVPEAHHALRGHLQAQRQEEAALAGRQEQDPQLLPQV